MQLFPVGCRVIIRLLNICTVHVPNMCRFLKIRKLLLKKTSRLYGNIIIFGFKLKSNFKRRCQRDISYFFFMHYRFKTFSCFKAGQHCKKNIRGFVQLILFFELTAEYVKDNNNNNNNVYFPQTDNRQKHKKLIHS
jgi:hypothetical protein